MNIIDTTGKQVDETTGASETSNITEGIGSAIKESFNETPLTLDQKIEKLTESQSKLTEQIRNLTLGLNHVIELSKIMMKNQIETGNTLNAFIELESERWKEKDVLKELRKEKEKLPEGTLKILLEQAIRTKTINLLDNYGTSLLCLAISISDKKLFSILLKHPEIDINHQDKNGETALMIAIKEGDSDSVELLLKHPEIRVNKQNKNGETALMIAIRKGDSDSVELLLKHPEIDINHRDKNGETALMIAIRKGDRDSVELLLKHPEICVDKQNKNGETALMIANYMGRGNLANLLEQHKQ